MGNRFKCSLAHGGSGGAEGNTLIVTCDPEFAGLTISASKSGTTYTKTCPITSPYTVTFHGLEAGTWTISTTLSGDTYSTSVTITDSTALLSYGFNWATWVTLGGLDPTDYSDLSDVFADEAAVRRLMLVHASADYLIDAVTGDVDVIDDFCADDTAMKWIGLCDYVCDGLTAISGVETKFLASTYWERYLKDHVPTMTSDTAPYGVASGTSYNTGNQYYKAFDKNSNTSWISTDSTNSRIIHKFTNPICVKKVSITPIAYGGYSRLKAFKVQGSNDGTTWNDLYEGEITSPTDIVTFEITNNSYYLYYSVLGTTANQTNVEIGLAELQFYGRSLNVSVPVMTGNTAPYGEAFSDYSGANAYYAFDNSTSTLSGAQVDGRLGYKFPDKINLKKVLLRNRERANGNILTFKIQGSNDGTWHDLSETLTNDKASIANAETMYDVNANDLYQNIAIQVLSIYSDSVGSVSTMQFYGVDYSEKEFEAGSTKKWIYDHGVVLEPISEAITTGGTITFGDDYVSFNRNAGANLSIATDSAIDFSSYNYLFTVIDTTGGSGHALIGYATSRTSSESSMTGKKTITAVGSDVKDGLDVSAVNTSEYPIVNATNTGTFNMKELWLAS